MFGNAIKCRGPFVASAMFLGAFDLLPLRPDGVDRFDFLIAEHVRVAPDQFIDNMPGGLLEVEGIAFFGQLTVEHDLKQKITQFFEHFVIVAFLNGIDQFVHFLDGVQANAHVGLDPVPRATFGRSKFRHHLEQIVDGRARFSQPVERPFWGSVLRGSHE